MSNTHRRIVLIALLLVALVCGISHPDSIWTVDMSSSCRICSCPVSGGAPVRSISVAGSGGILGVAAGDGNLWVLGPQACNKISKADPATGSVSAVLTVNVSYCGSSTSYGDGALWMLTGNSRIVRIDPVTGQVTRTVAPPVTSYIQFMAYGDGYLWIMDGAYYGRISKVDPSTGAIVQSMSLSGTDFVNALAYGGGYLWVGGLMGPSKITKVDPSNGAVVSTAAYGTGWPITSIAYDGGGSPAPPPAPAVTDDGAYTPRSDSLHASWAAGTGITEYQYAIGTSPTELIVGWRSSGTATEASAPGLSLQSGTTYYWYVKAKNSAGQWSGVGASDGIVVGTPSTVWAARSAPVGRQVVLASVVVTAKYSDCAYVESADRSSGIRITGTSALSPGQRADIAGEVEMAFGEKSVRATTCAVTGTGSVAPVGMQTSGIAVYGPNAGVASALGTVGLCSAGLLVRTWGEVTARGSGFFYVDDGSHPKDGTGDAGLRILCDGIAAPALGRRVQVTGISTLFSYADTYLPALRLRDSADLKLLD